MTILVGTDAGERLTGGAEDDSLIGRGGDDELLGAFGVDTLRGGGGDDTLNGGHDSDGAPNLLSGGSGDDLIWATHGSRISGGAGFDSILLDLTGLSQHSEADLRALDGGGQAVLPGGTVLSGVETGALATFCDANARDSKLRALAAKVTIDTSAKFEQEEADLTFETIDGQKIEIHGEAAQSASTAAADQDSLLPKVRALLRPIYGDAATESLIESFRALHSAARLPDIAAGASREAAAE